MGGLQDFAQGAAGGALAGSTLGPLGGIAGGLIGGLGGFFGGNPDDAAEAERRKYLRGVNQRQAPTLGPANTADYSGFRNNQANLISQLEAMARGEGPSVSREQLNQATNRNIAAQNALAANGRGGNLGMMMAMNNTGRLGAQAAQDAALGRVQEQNAAINNLGMQIYSGRNADEDTNRFNASQRNQMAQQNAANQLSFWANQDQSNLGGMQMASRGPSLSEQILAGGGALNAMRNTMAGNGRAFGNGGPQNSWANR